MLPLLLVLFAVLVVAGALLYMIKQEMGRLKQALVMARMPTLVAVGLLLTIWGAQGNEPTMLGAGLVIVGLWSGAAVAEGRTRSPTSTTTPERTDMTQQDWILALVILADILLALIILGVRR